MTRKSNAKRNTSNRAFPCVLKSIINDAHNDDASFALNDKQIRSRLRAKFNDAHIKNTSWIATSSREYDALRCAFDASYRALCERRAKRVTTKRATKSNVVVVTNDVDA